MCQYNNIYIILHKYLKEKKNTNRLLKKKKKKHKPIIEKKKKKTLGTVAIVPVNNCENIVKFVASVYNIYTSLHK